ncbi:MAG: LCP family protein [Thermotogota bacterium]
MKEILLKIIGVALSLLILFSLIFSIIKNINIKDNFNTPYYFLVIGIDSIEEYDSRTDTLLLGAIENNEVRFFHFPRDLLLKVQNQERRINSIYSIFGMNELINQVEKISKIQIEDYIFFNYEIFKEIGNMISPVKIYIENDMKYTDYHQNLNINFEKGINNLNGEELLSYMRFRHDAMGDIGRIERQKKALYSMLDSAQKKGFRSLFDIFQYVQENTKNSFDLKKMMSLYSYLREAQFTFDSLPTVIEESYLLLNEEKINSFRDKVKFEIIDDSKAQSLWILFSKNYLNYDYSFYTYIFDKWEISGYRLKVLDKKIENLSSEKSLVFMKNNSYKSKIIPDLEKTFPNNEFIIVNDDKVYLQVIDYFANNLIDTTDYDALVIMNE